MIRKIVIESVWFLLGAMFMLFFLVAGLMGAPFFNPKFGVWDVLGVILDPSVDGFWLAVILLILGGVTPILARY